MVGDVGTGAFCPFPLKASSCHVASSVSILVLWSPRNERVEGVRELGGGPQLSPCFWLRPRPSIIGLDDSWEWPGHLEEGVGGPGALRSSQDLTCHVVVAEERGGDRNVCVPSLACAHGEHNEARPKSSLTVGAGSDGSVLETRITNACCLNG